MSRIGFYQLAGAPLGSVLPRLLERTLEAGARAVVMAPDQSRVEVLNRQLWTYEERSWLPHGTAREGHAERQPVWLTSDDENPNGATYLFLTDGTRSDRVDGFERVFVLFDGNSPADLRSARDLWRSLRAEEHELTYWKQDGRRWHKAG